MSSPNPINVLVTANGLAVTMRKGQKAFLQNWGTVPVYVRRGAIPTTTNACFILAAGDANDDGKGGSIEIKDFGGKVYVLGNGGAARVNTSLSS